MSEIQESMWTKAMDEIFEKYRQPLPTDEDMQKMAMLEGFTDDVH